MKHRQLIIILVSLILVLCGVMFVRGLTESGTKEESVSIAQAGRALALLSYTTEDCKEAKNHFQKEEAWYTPYFNLLYEKGYLLEKEVLPSEKGVGRNLTYGLLKKIYQHMEIEDKKLLSYVKNHKEREVVMWEEWAEIITLLGEKKESPLQTQTILLTGTKEEIPSLEEWRAQTSAGEFYYTGLPLAQYLDCKLEVITVGEELLCIRKVEKQVVYRNAYVIALENGKLQISLNGVKRSFTVKDKDMAASGVLADIYMKNGKVVDCEIKKDFVSGKLYQYNDTSATINGTKYDFDENIKVYRTYGTVEEKSIYDMVVGYDVQKFVISDGKICGVMIDRNLVAENIRVVIKNTGFTGIYHDSILVSSENEFSISDGIQTRNFAAGEEYTIDAESPYLAGGSLKLASTGAGKIMIKSIERGYGTPSYRGSMEVLKTENGLVLINELSLEQYLYGVIPSEMPYTYSTEALKAQAVCARSYAYKQMLSHTYAYLGAHVDDSTAFQVYNNSAEQVTTTQAVDETYGEILTWQEEPISAFFYSTSCGSSTDADIWGGNGYAYIRGRMLTEEPTDIDLTDEAQFQMFIRNAYDTYDSEYGWYRWSVTIPLDVLTEGVNRMLAQLYEQGPEKVLTLTGQEYISKPIDTVGNVISVKTGERGTGGVLKYVEIQGDRATVRIMTESFIRKIFQPVGCAITKADESQVDSFQSLPSAFFALEEVEENGVRTGYQFFGGGYGHGAGMSQNAANTMSNRGIGYENILKFFYHDVTLSKIY